jgi:ubiquitin-protein ligase E3 A
MDPPELLKAERVVNEEMEANVGDLLLPGAVGHEPKERTPPKEDALGKELGVNALNCKEPLIPWADFINEPLCEHIESHRAIGHFKAEGNKFTFLNHAFLLTPCVKHLGLYYDNRSRMINERRVSLFQSFVHGAPTMPYLRLRIRRAHIIDDALVEVSAPLAIAHHSDALPAAGNGRHGQSRGFEEAAVCGI